MKDYQGSIFEMYLAERLTEQEFNVLSALSEGMEEDGDAIEIAIKLTLPDLQDQDLVDCILARQFKTARLIIE